MKTVVLKMECEVTNKTAKVLRKDGMNTGPLENKLYLKDLKGKERHFKVVDAYMKEDEILGR